MGNATTTTGVHYNKTQIDIALSKATQYLKLARNRKVELLQKKESELLSKLEVTQMSMAHTYEKACINAKILIYIKAANVILRHLDVLSNHSFALERGQSSPGQAADLVPSMNTFIWGTYKLNVGQLEEVVMMIGKVMGPGWINAAQHGYMVDLGVRRSFANILPDQWEMNFYIHDFVIRSSNGDQKRQGILYFLTYFFRMDFAKVRPPS